MIVLLSSSVSDLLFIRLERHTVSNIFFGVVEMVFNRHSSSEFVQSVVVLPDNYPLELILRLAICAPLFVANELVYAGLLALVLDRENWGFFEYLHLAITNIPCVVSFVLQCILKPINFLIEWVLFILKPFNLMVERLRHFEDQSQYQGGSLEINTEIDCGLPPPYFKVW